MAGSSPVMPPGPMGQCLRALVFLPGRSRRLWFRRPAFSVWLKALAQAGREVEDSSRRYLRATSLQFSATVHFVSAAFVLVKRIPSDT
jgi:hypothetical protein